MSKQLKAQFMGIRWAIVTDRGLLLEWTLSYIRKAAIEKYCGDHSKPTIDWNKYRKKHKLRCAKVQVTFTEIEKTTNQ